jgi:GNAT superfamily N-acetyltransferase
MLQISPHTLDGRHVRPIARHDLAMVAGMMTRLAQHHGDPAAVAGQGGAPVDMAGLDADLFGPVPLLHGLVAERFGFVVGYALMLPRYRAQVSRPVLPRILDVEQLYVHEGSRGRGLGRMLMAGITAHAQREGFTVLAAGQLTENARGHEFFERIGFAPGGDVGLVTALEPIAADVVVAA